MPPASFRSRALSLLCFIICCFLALACVTCVQADYSYSEGTPGTTWGGNAVNAGNSPLLAPRKLAPIGLTFAGAAQGNNVVLNDNQFNCGAIITAISTGLTAIPPIAQVAKPAALSQSATQAEQLVYQAANALYQKYLTDIAATNYVAARYMSQDVIGVAVVDYGTAQNPDVRAFLFRSGTNAAVIAKQQSALTYAASLQPGNTRLSSAARWHFIDTTVSDPADLTYVKDYRSAHIVTVPSASDIQTWADDHTVVGPNNSEGILFGVWVSGGVCRVAKKWPTGQNNLQGNPAFYNDATTHRTTCAMQKLMYTLFGMNTDGSVPGGGPRLRGNAQNQADNVNNLPRLVCAAESAHSVNGVPVKEWNNNSKNYPTSVLVPSCTMCQSIVPEIISGAIYRDCAALNLVADGQAGTCGAITPHGHTCSVTCNQGYYPYPPQSRCSFGTRSAQTCQRPCIVADQTVITLNNNVVANASPAALGVSDARWWTGHSTVPIPMCKHELRRGHACRVGCPGGNTAANPDPHAVVCNVNGALEFPYGNAPTCERDCNTPEHQTETANSHGQARVPKTNSNIPPPCGATLQFGARCAPRCSGQNPHPQSYAKCDANQQLSRQATCGPNQVQPVLTEMHVSTQAEEVSETHVIGADLSPMQRLTQAKLKRSLSSQVLQP